MSTKTIEVFPRTFLHRGVHKSKVMIEYALDKRVIGILPVLLLLTMCLSCQADFQGTHTVVKFDAGKGRVIEVRADNFNDNGQGFYYRVTVDKRVKVGSLILFGYEDAYEPDFTIITARNGDVIGIAKERFANTILAVYDFNSGQSWPGACSPGSERQCRRNATTLLEILQKEHSSLRLSLRGGSPSDESPGSCSK